MDGTKKIEVRLPDDAQPTTEDLETLDATFNAIVTLRFQGGQGWEPIERALVAGGWEVRSRLMWVAEARRGRDSEQGVGRTKEEAYSRLQELTKIDELTGVQ
ncbi:MAG TPA: hypothetical protein VK886_09055 [Vicinamibacterales bacterium]|nr:hypothetical protein [Vicinamibacterales bacterium]